MNDIVFYNNFRFIQAVFSHQKYTDHRTGSPYHYLAYMIKGHSKIVSENITIELWPGDLFYIPEGLPYQSYWDSEDDIRFLSFGFHHFPEARANQFYLQKIPCNEALKKQVQNIPIKDTVDSTMLGTFYSVLAQVIPCLACKEQPSQKEVIAKATAYICDHINCSVSDVAAHCMMSKSALYHIFKQQGDMTPNALIQKIRCQKAETLLSTTDRSVQEISDALQFSSTSYFRKVLRLYTGKTPRQIRNQAKRL